MLGKLDISLQRLNHGFSGLGDDTDEGFFGVAELKYESGFFNYTQRRKGAKGIFHTINSGDEATVADRFKSNQIRRLGRAVAQPNKTLTVSNFLEK